MAVGKQMVVSQGGKCIVACSGNLIRLWVMQLNQWHLSILRGHHGTVRSLAMSRHRAATVIVSGSDDKTVRAWTKNHILWKSTVLNGHTRPVTAVSISEDGTCIVSGSDDMTVRVWTKAQSQWKSTVLNGHISRVREVSISKDGTRIVSKGNTEVRVWNLHNEKWKPSVLPGQHSTCTITWSPIVAMKAIQKSFNSNNIPLGRSIINLYRIQLALPSSEQHSNPHASSYLCSRTMCYVLNWPTALLLVNLKK